MPFLSVITPVYGCKTCLYELYFRLKESLEKITPDFEIIFVNDASPDCAWETIVELTNKDKRVKGIDLSRNFGQHYAITAGLDHCSGEWVVIMDCDLQDNPEEIPKFIYEAKLGNQIVLGRRISRKDGIFRKIASKIFFKILEYFTESNIDRSIGNFALYNYKVIDSYKKIKERDQALVLFIKWLGYDVTYIDIEHSKRHSGKSSYNMRKMLNLGINSILSQTNKPLKLSIKFGFIMSFCAILYAIHLIYRYYTEDILPGYSSIMVSIFFIGGLLFANMGLIGLYLGKIFDETKNRPLYIIKDKIGFDKNIKK